MKSVLVRNYNENCRDEIYKCTTVVPVKSLLIQIMNTGQEELNIDAHEISVQLWFVTSCIFQFFMFKHLVYSRTYCAIRVPWMPQDVFPYDHGSTLLYMIKSQNSKAIVHFLKTNCNYLSVRKILSYSMRHAQTMIFGSVRKYHSIYLPLTVGCTTRTAH